MQAIKKSKSLILKQGITFNEFLKEFKNEIGVDKPQLEWSLDNYIFEEEMTDKEKRDYLDDTIKGVVLQSTDKTTWFVSQKYFDDNYEILEE